MAASDQDRWTQKQSATAVPAAELWMMLGFGFARRAPRCSLDERCSEVHVHGLGVSCRKAALRPYTISFRERLFRLPTGILWACSCARTACNTSHAYPRTSCMLQSKSMRWKTGNPKLHCCLRTACRVELQSCCRQYRCTDVQLVRSQTCTCTSAYMRTVLPSLLLMP